jgi:PAS domain-containing protein
MSYQVPSWVQEVFETDQDVLYLLDADLRIAECNAGWDKFAAENGGVGISRTEVRGRPIFDFIPEVLVRFYRNKFAEALRGGHWIGFDYECSTPDVFRQFHMALRSVEYSGLLVVNSYLANQRIPLASPDQVLADAAYLSPGGMITMCAHCRRTRRQDDSNTWDWVPRFLRYTGRKTSHGLCPRCTAYLYPDLNLPSQKR